MGERFRRTKSLEEIFSDMAYQRGREEGLEAGLEAGGLLEARAMFRELLRLRFPSVSDASMARVDAATLEDLRQWRGRLPSIESVENLMA